MSEQCRTCLLPEVVPGANVDHGVCQFCRDQPLVDLDLRESVRERRQQDLEETLATCRGQGPFDCLVNLSGGKDSCLLLYKLKVEYDLNVLAFTADINVPDIAWKNIRRTVEKLDVPHMTFRPRHEFYRKMFRFLLQNQEERGAVRTVCYICAPLYEAYSLQLATNMGIPLVVAGYSPGQPDPDRMVYEFPPRMISEHDWTPPEIRNSEQFTEEELRLFWNPAHFTEGTRFPRYLAPFHAWPYSQDEAMRLVVELGLIAKSKWASPVHSNCPVNWLLMYSDLKNLGYNPYAPEFSSLIREGKANRTYWRFMGPIVNFMIRRKVLLGRNVSRSLKWLGLSTADLKITRAASDSASAPVEERELSDAVTTRN